MCEHASEFLKESKHKVELKIIDEIDVKILKALLKNARTSFTDIAQDCGVSTNNVVQRFYKLQKSGIITGTALRLNLKKFNRFAITIDIDVNHKEADRLVEFLLKIPGLFSCYKLLGKHDVHTAILTTSLEEIDQIRDRIKLQKGVKKVWVSTGLDEVGCFPENLVIKPSENRTNG